MKNTPFYTRVKKVREENVWIMDATHWVSFPNDVIMDKTMSQSTLTTACWNWPRKSEPLPQALFFGPRSRP